MTDAETRALGRAAALLLAASVLRWGWSAVGGRPVGPAGPDETSAILAASQTRVDDAAARARPLGAGERLDPNRASEAELDRLPGVGAATARAIVRSREEDGPFLRAEDLARVRGLGESTVRKIRGQLDFGSAPPQRLPAPGPPGPRPPAGGGVPSPAGGRAPTLAKVDVNRADEAELQTLPGVGPALARRIVEARALRPFRAPEELTRVRGIGPATVERLRSRILAGG